MPKITTPPCYEKYRKLYPSRDFHPSYINQFHEYLIKNNKTLSFVTYYEYEQNILQGKKAYHQKRFLRNFLEFVYQFEGWEIPKNPYLTTMNKSNFDKVKKDFEKLTNF